jgi:hypothetical protein
MIRHPILNFEVKVLNYLSESYFCTTIFLFNNLGFLRNMLDWYSPCFEIFIAFGDNSRFLFFAGNLIVFRVQSPLSLEMRTRWHFDRVFTHKLFKIDNSDKEM